MASESMRCACGVALEGPPWQAYNEEAFRHLLAIERRRAARSQRSGLLVLVSVRSPTGASDRMPRERVKAIFAGLAAVVRDVDFVGWFREDRIAAAFLTQGSRLSTEAPIVIGGRVTEALQRILPPLEPRRLHVRVLQLRRRRNL